MLVGVIPTHGGVPVRPRLIVVISYDQMRGDFLTKFSPFFGSGGFKRVMRSGLNATNCTYEHACTATGPGHATIMSGHYAHRTGITGNIVCAWGTNDCMSCTTDDKNADLLRVPTIGDVWRAAHDDARVVSLAVKDRTAIMMGGHDATACVWFDPASRTYTSSQAYPPPAWLSSFTMRSPASQYAGQTWSARIPERLGPARDDVIGEGTMSNGQRTFPYTLPPLDSAAFVADYVRSPFSVEHLFDLALTAVDYEQLGADATTDLLCIGVSSTDVLGHVFGPDSREVQEMFVACDAILARFLTALDRRIGKQRYAVVITSDHGVAPIPEIVAREGAPQNPRIDAGRIDEDGMEMRIVESIRVAFPALAPALDSSSRAVFTVHEPNLYIQHETVRQRGVAVQELTRHIRDVVAREQGMGYAVERSVIIADRRPATIDTLTWKYIRAAFDSERSGDVIFAPKRYWTIGGNVANHGTPHNYDRWVPLVISGPGIRAQHYTRPCQPTDIAPTIARMLGVKFECEGVALNGGRRTEGGGRSSR
jgi:predicted AlkP superfamily pyrophosphatase or phosphodiesterase